MDEAVYAFGNYVESEVYAATEKVKSPKGRENKRKQTLAVLLQDREESEEVVMAQHDPTDPVSPEVAKRMPPARKFDKRQFADPANLFKRAAQKKQQKGE